MFSSHHYSYFLNNPNRHWDKTRREVAVDIAIGSLLCVGANLLLMQCDDDAAPVTPSQSVEGQLLQSNLPVDAKPEF